MNINYPIFSRTLFSNIIAVNSPRDLVVTRRQIQAEPGCSLEKEDEERFEAVRPPRSLEVGSSNLGWDAGGGNGCGVTKTLNIRGWSSERGNR